MKRIAAILSAFLFVAGSAQGANDTYVAPDANTAKVGESIIQIWELSSGNFNSNRDAMIFPEGKFDYTNANRYICPNEKIISQQAPCDFAKSNNYLYGSNLLPVCQSRADNFCVESLAFGSSNSFTTGQHTGYAGGDTYEAIPELGIEPASQASLWKVPGWENSSGADTYVVSVRSRQEWKGVEKGFETVSLDLAITPYQEVSGNFQAPKSKEGKDVNGLDKVYVNGSGSQWCTWSDEGKCGKIADFVGNPDVKLVIRASNDLSGWFRGRISETKIAISEHSSLSNKIEISGKPVSVPRFHVYANKQNTPQAVQDIFPRGSGGTGLELFEGNSIKSVFATGGKDTYTVLDSLRAAVNDTAAGISSLWSIESIPLGNEPCFANATGVIGVVSTNATAYDGTAPGFEGGQLTYKVAGLHYAPDGKTLNLGTYDLVMRSDIARCLYGFSSAPVSAKIQVLTENGEAVVASTVVSERNGWLNLAAYGFTFSEKNIKVELTQFKPRKITLTSFKGSSTQLSTSQRKAIANVLTGLRGATSITCTAYGSKTTAKNISLTRAKNACSVASRLANGITASPQVKITSQKSWVGKVDISVR